MRKFKQDKLPGSEQLLSDGVLYEQASRRAAPADHAEVDKLMDQVLSIPHTFGGFCASFAIANARQPTAQEIFSAGLRAGRDLEARESSSPSVPVNQQVDEIYDNFKLLRDELKTPGYCDGPSVLKKRHWLSRWRHPTARSSLTRRTR